MIRVYIDRLPLKYFTYLLLVALMSACGQGNTVEVEEEKVDSIESFFMKYSDIQDIKDFPEGLLRLKSGEDSVYEGYIHGYELFVIRRSEDSSVYMIKATKDFPVGDVTAKNTYRKFYFDLFDKFKNKYGGTIYEKYNKSGDTSRVDGRQNSYCIYNNLPYAAGGLDSRKFSLSVSYDSGKEVHCEKPHLIRSMGYDVTGNNGKVELEITFS